MIAFVNNFYDVIIIGLGAMGSAASYQSAKRGLKVLGIDRYYPPHTNGSTHGETRITRQAIGEGEAYVPLALRSHELWREIEAETGADLLTVTGGVLIGEPHPVISHGTEHFFDQAVAAAQKFNLEHEVMDAEEWMKRFPQFRLKGDERIFFEKNAGFVRPEVCISAQLSLAEKHGATLQTGEICLKYVCNPDNSVSVTTNKGEYRASKLIIAAGPWIRELLPEYGSHFQIFRQVLYWYALEDPPEQFFPEHFPVFIWDGNDGTYGFPAVNGEKGGIKIACEEYAVSTTPENVDRNVTEEEKMNMYEKHVKPYFPGISDECIRAASCLYTVTPDSNFVIDVHPDHSQIIIASPCSGHGFKHSAAIGEVLAEMASTGESSIDISEFSLSRLTAGS